MFPKCIKQSVILGDSYGLRSEQPKLIENGKKCREQKASTCFGKAGINLYEVAPSYVQKERKKSSLHSQYGSFGNDGMVNHATGPHLSGLMVTVCRPIQDVNYTQSTSSLYLIKLSLVLNNIVIIILPVPLVPRSKA